MQLAMTSAPKRMQRAMSSAPQKDRDLYVTRPTKGWSSRHLPLITPIEKIFPKGSNFSGQNYSLLKKIIYRE